MKDLDENPRLLPPPTGETPHTTAPGRWAAQLRPPRLWRTIAAGSSALALILGVILWSGHADQAPIERIDEMQRQVAILQSQHNAGSSNVASIQGQLAGLQTQLLVLQNQMIQLQRGHPLPSTAQPASVPTPPARPTGGTDAENSTSARAATATALQVPTKPLGQPSAAELSHLINEGLKGKDRSRDPIYQQIMYSSLDLGSAYAVSLAAWGPEPSPLLPALQQAQITDFSFRKSPDDNGVLIVTSSKELEQALTRLGAQAQRLGDKTAFAFY